MGRSLSAAHALALDPVSAEARAGAALESTDQHIWFLDEIF